jgi:tetratricopeptide (TPR) repeat protein
MPGPSRERVAAGASTLLAVVAGVLINMVTSGWTWPLVIGLAVFVAGWTGFEVWRTNPPPPPPPPDSVARDGGLRPGHAPALPAGAAPAGRFAQLPFDTAGFTGRGAELDRLLAMVDDPGGAVVICAVDGMAGIGKTALAVHAAHRLTDHFPDGTLFLDLHGYTESVTPVPPGRALQRLLLAIGVPGERIPAEVDDQAALWRTRLAGKRMLIVLDNARTADQVRPLLPATPGCLVLVTSRRRLVALDDARSLSIDVLPDADAAALFARVAGADRVAGHPDAVEEVVARCGRLPLAVRIAAARLRARPTWTVRDLADQLGDRAAVIDRLDDGERSVLAALALSVDDLDADRQRVFRRLSLHPGTDVDPGAAAALDGADPGWAAEVLEGLIDAHLLIQAVPGRYLFHDLVRDYAAHLTATAEPEPVRRECRRRLFDHYAGRTAAAMAALHLAEPGSRPPASAFPTTKAALSWLDAERANIVAVSTAAATEHPEATIRLSALLNRYLNYAGHHEQALILHGLALDAAGDPAVRAEALRRLGTVLRIQGRDDAAKAHFDEALTLHTSLGDRAGQARVLIGLGLLHLGSGSYDEAADALTRALVIEREVGNPSARADVADVLAMVRERQGRDDDAVEHFGVALRLYRSLGDHIGEAGALDGLGCIASRQGRHTDAVGLHHQAIKIHQMYGNRHGEGDAICDLGLDLRRSGDVAGAIDRHEQALAIYTSINYPRGEVEARNGLGEAYLAAGRTGPAEREHRRALALAIEIGDRYEQARARAGLESVPLDDHGV